MNEAMNQSINQMFSIRLSSIKTFGYQILHMLGERKLVYSKIKKCGLPWWCSGSESACQCRGHGFEPWSGKIPHATEQLGP